MKTRQWRPIDFHQFGCGATSNDQIRIWRMLKSGENIFEKTHEKGAGSQRWQWNIDFLVPGLVNIQKTMEKHILMGKLTISMAIFNSYFDIL
jgi:hypothetical protein